MDSDRAKLEQLKIFYLNIVEISNRKLDRDQFDEMKRLLAKVIDGSMNGANMIPLFQKVLTDSPFPVEKLTSIMYIFPILKDSRENVLAFCNMLANEATNPSADTKKKFCAHTLKVLQTIANNAIMAFGFSESKNKPETNTNNTNRAIIESINKASAECLVNKPSIDCFFSVANWGTSISSYLACMAIKMSHLNEPKNNIEVDPASLSSICAIISYALETRLRMIVEHAHTQVQMRCVLVDPNQNVIPKRLIHRVDYSLEQMRFLQDVVQVQIKNRSKSEINSAEASSAANKSLQNLQKQQQQEIDSRNAANMAALKAIGNVQRKRTNINESRAEVSNNLDISEGEGAREVANFDMKDPKVLAKLRQQKTLRNINNKILVSDVQNLLLRERLQNCFKNKYLFESLMFD